MEYIQPLLFYLDDISLLDLMCCCKRFHQYVSKHIETYIAKPLSQNSIIVKYAKDNKVLDVNDEYYQKNIGIIGDNIYKCINEVHSTHIYFELMQIIKTYRQVEEFERNWFILTIKSINPCLADRKHIIERYVEYLTPDLAISEKVLGTLSCEIPVKYDLIDIKIAYKHDLNATNVKQLRTSYAQFLLNNHYKYIYYCEDGDNKIDKISKISLDNTSSHRILNYNGKYSDLIKTGCLISKGVVYTKHKRVDGIKFPKCARLIKCMLQALEIITH